MYGIQLPSGVPAQDPANGTNLTVDSSGQLQLSIGGAAPNPVAAGQVDPGQRIIVANDGDPINFTGLDGTTAGGYYMEGLWITDGVTDGNLILQINGVTSGYSGGSLAVTNVASWTQTQDPGGGPVTSGALIGRAGGAAGRNQLRWRAWVTPGDGSGGTLLVSAESEAFASSGTVAFETFRVLAPVAISGRVTGIKVVATAGTVKAGSYARIQKTGFTA